MRHARSAVQTSISLPNLLAEDPAELRFENKGYLGGGGGRDRVRKNFLACAYWNAALTTDAQGQGHRPLRGARQPDPLPDLRGSPYGQQPLRQRAIRIPGEQAAGDRARACRPLRTSPIA